MRMSTYDPNRPVRQLAADPQGNPPVAEGDIAGKITAALTALGVLLGSVATWLVTALPDAVPAEVEATLLAFTVAAIGVVIAYVRRLPALRALRAQAHTYPARDVEEYVLDAEAVIGEAKAVRSSEPGRL